MMRPNLERVWLDRSNYPTLIEDALAGIRYSGVYEFDWVARLT